MSSTTKPLICLVEQFKLSSYLGNKTKTVILRVQHAGYTDCVFLSWECASSVSLARTVNYNRTPGL